MPNHQVEGYRQSAIDFGARAPRQWIKLATRRGRNRHLGLARNRYTTTVRLYIRSGPRPRWEEQWKRPAPRGSTTAILREAGYAIVGGLQKIRRFRIVTFAAVRLAIATPDSGKTIGSADDRHQQRDITEIRTLAGHGKDACG